MVCVTYSLSLIATVIDKDCLCPSALDIVRLSDRVMRATDE